MQQQSQTRADFFLQGVEYVFNRVNESTSNGTTTAMVTMDP